MPDGLLNGRTILMLSDTLMFLLTGSEALNNLALYTSVSIGGIILYPSSSSTLHLTLEYLTVDLYMSPILANFLIRYLSPSLIDVE